MYVGMFLWYVLQNCSNKKNRRVFSSDFIFLSLNDIIRLKDGYWIKDGICEKEIDRQRHNSIQLGSDMGKQSRLTDAFIKEWTSLKMTDQCVHIEKYKMA